MFRGVVVVLGLLASGAAQASPSEAAGVGGLDLWWPNGLDTTEYFSTDVNVFTNPGLADAYRDTVQVHLGHAGGGPFEGAGLAPRGFGLFALNGTMTLGFALNRDPSSFGEAAALGPTLDALMDGSSVSGQVGGGRFRDPVSLAGRDTPATAVGLAPPLDVFAAFDTPVGAIGVDLYAGFGQASSRAETQTDPVADEWTSVQERARSSWLSGTVGWVGASEKVVPEAWVEYTGVSAWHDQLAFAPAARGSWAATDEVVDQTVGLKGTRRIGVGGRVTIVGEKLDIVPAIQFDTASGGTFANYRLMNDVADAVEGPIARAETDTVAVTTHFLRGGVGLTYRPVENLRVVGTASGGYLVQRRVFDDNGDVDAVAGTAHERFEASAHGAFLPLVSLGAEYLATEHFGVRGSARATTFLNQGGVVNVAASGDEAASWALTENAMFASSSTGGVAPGLSVAAGPALRFDHVAVDGVLGGLVVGAGTDLFSRLDVTFDW